MALTSDISKLKTKLKYAYYELNYEYQDREYSSVSLDILVCNYLLHQAHKELLKRIESEMTEHTSVEVLLISDIILFYMMHLNPQIHTHCNDASKMLC